MLDDMGIFRTTVAISALSTPDDRRVLSDVMVDTGSEYNWIPAETLHELGIAPVRIDRFETADGRVLEREVGFAMLFAGGRATPTIVVFAGANDLALLGAIGLEGLNLRVDLGRKELVPAGPVPAAAACVDENQAGVGSAPSGRGDMRSAASISARAASNRSTSSPSSLAAVSVCVI